MRRSSREWEGGTKNEHALRVMHLHLPGLRGLWVQAFIGVLVTRNFFLPFLLFLVLHYAVLWQSSFSMLRGADLADFLVPTQFMVVYGALSGLVWTWTLGNPVLVPAHTFHDAKARFGALLLVLSAVYSTWSYLLATGDLRAFEGAEPASDADEIVGWTVFAVSVAAFVTVIGGTLAKSRLFFALQYRDAARIQTIAVDYVVLTVAVLAPQVLWDVLPKSENQRWDPLPAGILALALETVAWLLAYAWFGWVRRVNHSEFKDANATWDEFVIGVGGVQMLSGIASLVAFELDGSPRATEAALAATSVGVALLSFAFGVWPYPLYRRDAGSKFRIATDASASTAKVIASSNTVPLSRASLRNASLVVRSPPAKHQRDAKRNGRPGSNNDSSSNSANRTRKEKRGRRPDRIVSVGRSLDSMANELFCVHGTFC